MAQVLNALSLAFTAVAATLFFTQENWLSGALFTVASVCWIIAIYFRSETERKR